MSEKERLQEQLILTYPKAEVLIRSGVLVIEGIPFKGIQINHNNGLYITFNGFDLIDFEALATYFKPRLKYKDTRLYYKTSDKSISVYVDKKFSNGSKGDFEKAMWFFNLIAYFIDTIKKVVNSVVE